MIFKNVKDVSALSTGKVNYTRLGCQKKFNFVGKVASRRKIKEFVKYCEIEVYAMVEPIEIIKRSHPRNGESMGIQIKKVKVVNDCFLSVSREKPGTFDQTGFESLHFEDSFIKKVDEIGGSIECAMSVISKHIYKQFELDCEENMSGIFGTLNCTPPGDTTLKFDDLIEACSKLDKIKPRTNESKMMPIPKPKPKDETLEWAKSLRFSLSGSLIAAVSKGIA